MSVRGAATPGPPQLDDAVFVRASWTGDIRGFGHGPRSRDPQVREAPLGWPRATERQPDGHDLTPSARKKRFETLATVSSERRLA